MPEATAGRLLAEIICPNCWHRFPPESILFIARHDSLIGDDIAGPMAYRRFLPTRFNITGDALDARGMACQRLACPRCHLEIVRPLIEMLPYFVSIVGVPASGKSYLLAAMTNEFRRVMPQLGLAIADGDPTANAELQRYEETLFTSPTPDKPVALRKTEVQGSELYQTVVLDGQSQTFPRAFQFTISPAGGQPDNGREWPYRALVLYDNAGEHFLPGYDSTAFPVTLHLAEAAAICFVYDPTQDHRFRARCKSADPQLVHGNRPGSQTVLSRQEVVLNEMAARVRRYKGLSQTSRHDKPLVMILAKADIWADLIGEDMTQEPLKWALPGTGPGAMRLDMATIQSRSDKCRQLMLETCPETVSAAEAFGQRVMYIPVSSLGCSPELVEQGETRYLGIRPRNIKPHWVTVPLLWALAQGVPGLIPVV